MLIGSDNRRPQRLFAALVLLCYCWVSAVIPFQHKDHLAHEAEALLKATGVSMRVAAPAPLQTRLIATTVQPIPDCAACEWQAANVSPALPAFRFALAPPATPRVITTFPRYLRLLALSTSARAPPLA
ncbi:MAG TPA: hypothetical protein VKT32_06860 [Chthonomonadaceae bacterium]|nr:hypothetical protein [Chthonomonadaceae bacterium]